MPRCPSCRELLPRDRHGARCPRCAEPIYETASVPRRRASATADACALHPDIVAHGTCQRCGNYQCRLCRTRWHNRTLCPLCTDRALELRETAPTEDRRQAWLAIAALILGLGAWLTTLAGALLAALAFEAGMNFVLIGVAGLVWLASPLPSALGLGLAAAAIRARGSYLILATIGLMFSGLHLGVMIGIFSMSIWQR